MNFEKRFQRMKLAQGARLEQLCTKDGSKVSHVNNGSVSQLRKLVRRGKLKMRGPMTYKESSRSFKRLTTLFDRNT